MYVSRGFRRVGTTTSISPGVHWAGRGRFPDPHISTGANSDPQQLSRYWSAEAEFLRVLRRNTLSRLPEPVPRHSPMSLAARQSTPAIDTAIYRPDSTLYQLQPSFHPHSTEPEPTARARRAGEEFLTGTGRHRVQIIYFFRMQIGSWRPLGVGLVVGKYMYRIRHRCSSLVLSESPGSHCQAIHGPVGRLVERSRPKMLEATASPV